MSKAIAYVMTVKEQSDQNNVNRTKNKIQDFCRVHDIKLLNLFEDIVDYEFHNPIRNGYAGKEMLNFVEMNSNNIDFFLVSDLTDCVEEEEWEQLRAFFLKHNIEVVELLMWEKLRPIMDPKLREKLEKEIADIGWQLKR
ncbi:hypothetical protein NC661_03160 [Aquibacillus koreensis]|uniref:Uncharacterized protein n=1 Tax=Aquibacillus koreensis TaxID=279446 RepID=A0A9X3WL94_9BACI|nr:hypothetical protein [Aquibacillus koreensis]MCT2536553.1 hypothetical protein [Aquibacillus koreensis]MDC3419359.1 hypothetical protein [Aquibacillus koreensis]